MHIYNLGTFDFIFNQACLFNFSTGMHVGGILFKVITFIVKSADIGRLIPIKEKLGSAVDYGELKLIRAYLTKKYGTVRVGSLSSQPANT